MTVSTGGWTAVSPWRVAIEEALTRANELLADDTWVHRLSPRVSERLRGMRHHRGRKRQGSKVSFHASVTREGPPVKARCDGRIELGVPHLFDMTIDRLSRQLARMGVLLKLRPDSCHRGWLRTRLRDHWWVDDILKALAPKPLSDVGGPGATVATRLGFPPASPLERRTAGMQGRLEQLLQRAAAPQLVVELYASKKGTARLRVNAKPWSRCGIGRGRMKTTPFEVTVSRQPVELRCEKGRNMQRLLIPRRLFAQPGAVGLKVEYGRRVSCLTDGVQLSGDAVTVREGRLGTRRIDCMRPSAPSGQAD